MFSFYSSFYESFAQQLSIFIRILLQQLVGLDMLPFFPCIYLSICLFLL